MVKGIGLRIKEIREKLNLTQNEFSDKICIKQANLSHIENKSTKISLEIVYKIISNFNINCEWLITGNGEMLKTISEKPLEAIPVETVFYKMIKEKDAEIMELNRRNWELETEVKNLKKQIEDSASARKRQVETIEIDIDNKPKANVG